MQQGFQFLQPLFHFAALQELRTDLREVTQSPDRGRWKFSRLIVSITASCSWRRSSTFVQLAELVRANNPLSRRCRTPLSRLASAAAACVSGAWRSKVRYPSATHAAAATFL